MASNPNPEVVSELQGKVGMWFYWAQAWERIYWGVGLTGVIMSTLAAATDVSGRAAPYFSVIAALCIAILGFANPQKRSAKFIRSYRILDPALRDYKYDDVSYKALTSAHRLAEDLLNDTEVFDTPPKTEPGRDDNPPPKSGPATPPVTKPVNTTDANPGNGGGTPADAAAGTTT